MFTWGKRQSSGRYVNVVITVLQFGAQNGGIYCIIVYVSYHYLLQVRYFLNHLSVISNHIMPNFNPIFKIITPRRYRKPHIRCMRDYQGTWLVRSLRVMSRWTVLYLKISPFRILNKVMEREINMFCTEENLVISNEELCISNSFTYFGTAHHTVAQL